MLKKIVRIILIFVFITIIIFGVVGFKLYSVFRLSYEEIVSVVGKENNGCKTIRECELLPGDILIRRYVTPVTRLFDAVVNPYFTHSAFYLGNGEIFEAVGNYTTPKDQIIISKLSESDWFDSEIESFVIIRPKNYSEKLEVIINDLREIANDPEYVFGPLKDGRKTVSCSDILLKSIVDSDIIPKNKYEESKIITPDYLFWALSTDKEGFDVTDHNITKAL